MFPTPRGMNRRHFIKHLAGSTAMAGTALAFAYDDVAKTAKAINDFNRGPKKLVVRGEIRATDRVVVVSTANGLKFTDFKVRYHDGELPEVPNPRHPYGLRGVGEVPVVPTMAAIANAIGQCIGVRPQSLPMSPPKLLKLIDEHRAKNGG